MVKEENLARMRELVEKLNQHAYEYYTLDNPGISDREYDILYDKLLKLEEKTGIILAESPTQRIGDVVLSEFKKHTHKARLWSLDKAQNEEQLKAWAKRIYKVWEEYNTLHEDILPPLSFVITLKFDGLTINLTYENGRLKHAATRGTGEVGEEILPQVKTIRSIPVNITNPLTMEIRGEALMTKQAFALYNQRAEIPLKNLRNAAAGALRNLNVRETARRNLSAFFYDLGYFEGRTFTTYLEILEFLEKENFPVHSYHPLCASIEEVIQEITGIADKRDSFDFEIDGLVIAVNDLKTREQLGYTIKFPRWAIAYKFEAEDALTRLIFVEWNVGRTGKVTPTALLEPVELGGVTVKRATLNNMDDIKRKGVKLASQVFIRRANDVIPEITGVLEEEEGTDIAEPEHCPACGAKLVRDGVHLFCENSLSCKPQLVKSIVHFASREAMNIEGFNEKTAEQLFDVLDIRQIADLYHLSETDLQKLDKFKEKKIKNLLTALEKSKDCSLDSFIYALGIPHVGKKTARDLAQAFRSIEKLREAKREELLEIPDIGEIVAESITKFFGDKEIQKSIDSLLASGIRPRFAKAAVRESPYRGKTVVVTGTLQKYTRSEIEEILSKLGANVSGSVSKKTDFLIVGENAGSKLDKARDILAKDPDNTMQIVTEVDFLASL